VGLMEKWIESLDYDYELVKSACVRYKSPRSTCDACVTACPGNSCFSFGVNYFWAKETSLNWKFIWTDITRI
jgi:hypothetical protein